MASDRTSDFRTRSADQPDSSFVDPKDLASLRAREGYSRGLVDSQRDGDTQISEIISGSRGSDRHRRSQKNIYNLQRSTRTQSTVPLSGSNSAPIPPILKVASLPQANFFAAYMYPVNDARVKSYYVYRSATDSFTTAVKINSFEQARNPLVDVLYFKDVPPTLQTVYYWFTSVNLAGVESLSPAKLTFTPGTIASRFINIKDYGAVGDVAADYSNIATATDSTTPFQNAINDLSTTGGTIYVPSGRYKITANLLVGGAVTTAAVSTGNGTVITGDSLNDVEIVTANNITMLTIGHVLIGAGNQSSQGYIPTDPGNSIRYCGVNNLQFTSTYGNTAANLADWSVIAIKLLGSYLGTFENILFKGIATGIELHGTCQFNRFSRLVTYDRQDTTPYWPVVRDVIISYGEAYDDGSGGFSGARLNNTFNTFVDIIARLAHHTVIWWKGVTIGDVRCNDVHTSGFSKPWTISATTNATPIAITTSTVNDVRTDDWIKITGTGIGAIDGNYYKATVTSGTTFTLQGTVAPGSTSSTGTATHITTSTFLIDPGASTNYYNNAYAFENCFGGTDIGGATYYGFRANSAVTVQLTRLLITNCYFNGVISPGVSLASASAYSVIYTDGTKAYMSHAGTVMIGTGSTSPFVPSKQLHVISDDADEYQVRLETNNGKAVGFEFYDTTHATGSPNATQLGDWVAGASVMSLRNDHLIGIHVKQGVNPYLGINRSPVADGGIGMRGYSTDSWLPHVYNDYRDSAGATATAAIIFRVAEYDGTNLKAISSRGIGSISFRGADSAAWPTSTSASILGIAEEAFSSTAHGTGIEIFTTKPGTTTNTRHAAILGRGALRLDELDSNVTIAEMPLLAAVAIYMKADILTFAYNSDGANMKYISIKMDGTTTTWTQGTTAP